jgi:hypothetical protein
MHACSSTLQVLLELTASELHILDGAPGDRQLEHPHVHSSVSGRRQGSDPRSAAAVLTEPCRCAAPAAAVYESEEYYRTQVQPQLEDGSTVAADVYVWKDEFRWGVRG